MRVSFEEPTGIWVRGPNGQEVTLTFKEFAHAIAEGAVGPDDLVCSRIVTNRQWVRAGDMRLYRMLHPHPAPESGVEPPGPALVWPPPPRRE